MARAGQGRHRQIKGQYGQDRVEHKQAKAIATGQVGRAE